MFTLEYQNIVSGDTGSEASDAGGEAEEGGAEAPEKGDRSHLVVWQVALPQTKPNPALLF